MATTNKTLGDYIEEVDNRAGKNEQYSLEDIRGISSITKLFQKTKANLVDVSPSGYKIVEPLQFAFNPNTARMGDKIPIALNLEDRNILVSSIYPVFKIKDHEQLDPQFLWLWFKRSEFDRYARFKSHGSAREIFSWEEMCAVKIPKPEISIQKKIVAQYNIAQKRIEILKNLNDRLEKTAYTKFLDMVSDSTQQALTVCCDTVLGGTPSRDKAEYWNGNIGWINSGAVNGFRIMEASEYITELALRKSATKIMPKGTTVLAITGATLGQYSRLCDDFCANQSVIGVMPKKGSNISNEFIYLSIKKNINVLLSGQTGGAQPHINSNDVKNLLIPESTREIEDKIKQTIKPIFDLIEINCREILALEKLSRLTSLSTNY